MKLFKDKVTEKLWVEMFGDGNLIDFAGHSYDGDVGELVEVNTDPNKKEFRRRHIIEETFKLNETKDWHLKDELLIPIDGNEVAFRVEHITDDKIYFVAVDAVGESNMKDMNQFLDDYLDRMPKSLVDRMCEIEHKANGNVIRKSKLALLSYANITKNTDNYKLDGTSDIPFDGLLTEAERCKNVENGESCWYWLDTPQTNSSTYFLSVGSCSGIGASFTLAVIPCFALSREPKENGKYLVKTREIYEHTYYVEAESKEAAEEITIDNSDGCDLDNDYTGVEYEVRELGDEDPDQYDECCVEGR